MPLLAQRKRKGWWVLIDSHLFFLFNVPNMFLEESQQSAVNQQIQAIYDCNLPNHHGRITLRLDSICADTRPQKLWDGFGTKGSKKIFANF
jgi:hypothetical protein